MTNPGFINVINMAIAKAASMHPSIAILAIHYWIVILGFFSETDVAALFSFVIEHIFDAEARVNILIHSFSKPDLFRKLWEWLCRTCDVSSDQRLKHPDFLSAF